MFNGQRIKAIIPALNEAQAIQKVLQAIPQWVDEVIVVDNGSNDGTDMVAMQCGAIVVYEPRRGYGQACLTGMANLGTCDITVFLDGDFSDYPDEMELLVKPIATNQADMVIGSRTQRQNSASELTVVQRFGNALACGLIRLLWSGSFTDLGPFRAVRTVSLDGLGMTDTSFGWTVEMQIKALRKRLRVQEAQVSYRSRIGKSKISGTITGSFKAGCKILWTIWKQLWNQMVGR
jgi:glycosyltransferase involved in cell wall biosynthesis